MWPVLLGAIVGGVFTLLGGVVGQVRQDRRVRVGAAQLLSYEMLLNAHAVETYLEKFGENPGDEDALEQAGRDMVVHSSTAVWRQHNAYLVPLFRDDFRVHLVSVYAALVSNEASPGRHRHATFEVVDILAAAQEELEPHTRLTWVDRVVWRL